MTFEKLETFAEVWAALGGNSGVAELMQAKPSRLSMWKKAGSFPPNTYSTMIDALRQRGKTAPDSLWRMKVPAEQESAA